MLLFDPSLRRYLLHLLLVPIVASCGSSADAPSSDPGGTTEGGIEAGAVVPCKDDGQAIDLDGVFALSGKLSFAFTSEQGGAITVCPTDQTSEGTVLGLVQIQNAKDSSTPQLTVRVCSIELPVISAIVGACDPKAENLVYAGIEFPSPLLDAFATLSPGESQGSLSSTKQGANFSTGLLSFGVGTRRSYDQTPSWLSGNTGCGGLDASKGRGQACEQQCVSSCADLADDDNDGWPGVTVNVCGYTREDKESNIACRADEPSTAGSTLQGRAAMTIHVSDLNASGTALSSCEASGGLDAAIHYQVVGADLYLANTPISVTSAIKSLPQYRVNQQSSRFRMVRIDGRFGAPNWSPNLKDPAAACHTIIAHQNDLK